MKPLRLEDLDNKTWGEIIRYYKPDATDEEVEFILWEKTCYPMDNFTTIEQLNVLFKAE